MPREEHSPYLQCQGRTYRSKFKDLVIFRVRSITLSFKNGFREYFAECSPTEDDAQGLGHIKRSKFKTLGLFFVSVPYLYHYGMDFEMVCRAQDLGQYHEGQGHTLRKGKSWSCFFCSINLSPR